MKLSLVVAASVAALGSAGAARAVTLDPAPVGWSAVAAVPKFSDASRTLTGVAATLDTTLTGSIKVENLQPSAAPFSGSVSTSSALTAPDGTLLAATSNSGGSGAPAQLGAFDGTIDYAGVSGRTFSFSNAASATSTVTAAASGTVPLAQFTGPGSASLGVATSGSASISAPLGVSAQLRSALGASVSLSYSSTAGTGAPGSGTITGGSGALMPPGSSVLLLNARTTPAQTRTVAASTAGWTAPLSFSRFDPSLGTLYFVNVSIGSTLTTTLSIDAANGPAGAFSLSQASTVALVTADGKTVGSVMDEIDRGGTAGAPAVLPTLADAVAGMAVQYSADLSPFIGAGDVTLSAIDSGVLAGLLPASADLLSGGAADATVTLSYTYVPGVAAPEPGSLAVVGAGLLALAGLRRRRG